MLRLLYSWNFVEVSSKSRSHGRRDARFHSEREVYSDTLQEIVPLRDEREARPPERAREHQRAEIVMQRRHEILGRQTHLWLGGVVRTTCVLEAIPWCVRITDATSWDHTVATNVTSRTGNDVWPKTEMTRKVY